MRRFWNKNLEFFANLKCLSRANSMHAHFILDSWKFRKSCSECRLVHGFTVYLRYNKQDLCQVNAEQKWVLDNICSTKWLTERMQKSLQRNNKAIDINRLEDLKYIERRI